MAATIAASQAPSRGRFITFEGGEGAGKSTQLRLLQQRLASRGIEVVATREPGGSPRAESIRALLLSAKVMPLGAFAETLLFAAARADHVERTIAPSLCRGAFVLCDRFLDSTRVYQGALGHLTDAALTALERGSVGRTRPDLTLILDLPAETGLARATARRAGLGEAVDRFESEAASFHARVRDAFLEIARSEPERCVVIDAAGLAAEVETRIWSAVELRLSEWEDLRLGR